MALVEPIPLKLGIILRRVLYRATLARIGTGVNIQPYVEFVNPNCTEIGNNVLIDRYARIKNSGRDSKICIGDSVRINRGADLKVHSGGNGYIEIGESVIIGAYSCLSGLHIKIGKFSMLGPHTGIFANNHIFKDSLRYINSQGHTYQGIIIEDDCWLGCGVKVVDGVTIGRGSVIGAGSVVTKDIPPYSIAAGTPAKIIAKRNEDYNHNLVHLTLGTSEG